MGEGSRVSVDTQQSDYDTRIAVFVEGSSCAELGACVAAASGTPGSVEFDAQSGTTYLIRIDDFPCSVSQGAEMELTTRATLAIVADDGEAGEGQQVPTRPPQVLPDESASIVPSDVPSTILSDVPSDMPSGTPSVFPTFNDVTLQGAN